MSETNQGTPTPASQPQGDLQQPGQPQTPVAAQPAQSTPATQQTPAAPANAELETLRRELEQTRNSARHFQSQFDRAQQQVRALAGTPQPAADPIAQQAAFLESKGYDKQQARDMAEFVAMQITPLTQRNQQLEAQLQGTSMVQQAMQAAVQANPELFSDQAVANATYGAMQEAARQGNVQLITPEYAKYLGAQEWALRNEPWKPQATQQQPQPQPQRIQFGQPMPFTGPPAGYTPAAPAMRQVDPAVAQYDSEIKAHFGLKPKQ